DRVGAGPRADDRGDGLSRERAGRDGRRRPRALVRADAREPEERGGDARGVHVRRDPGAVEDRGGEGGRGEEGGEGGEVVGMEVEVRRTRRAASNSPDVPFEIVVREIR